MLNIIAMSAISMVANFFKHIPPETGKSGQAIEVSTLDGRMRLAAAISIIKSN